MGITLNKPRAAKQREEILGGCGAEEADKGLHSAVQTNHTLIDLCAHPPKHAPRDFRRCREEGVLGEGERWDGERLNR